MTDVEGGQVDLAQAMTGSGLAGFQLLPFTALF